MPDKNPYDDIYVPEIMILGVGCILFSDEGFGVRVIETIQERYEFPDNVLVVDGGVLGINLLGVISKPDHLIVVDAIRNKGKPGDMYRLARRGDPGTHSGQKLVASGRFFRSADLVSGP